MCRTRSSIFSATKLKDLRVYWSYPGSLESINNVESLVYETRADRSSHSKQYHSHMIKSTHTILRITLCLWKHTFSQAQHSLAPKWCNTSNKDAIWRSMCFCNSSSKYPAQLASLCCFLSLYQLVGYHPHIHCWLPWGIVYPGQRDEVRQRWATEILRLHCSQIVWKQWGVFLGLILLSSHTFLYL